MPERMLPVLMYHGLHAEGAPGPPGPHGPHGRYDPVYSVHPDAFARQLDWLLEHGYRGLTVDDLDRAAPLDGRRVLITFDDGDRSNLEVALPLLVARGLVAEFFVTADFVGRHGMLAPADLRTLVEAGMGVQSHGASHRFLSELDAGELAHELADSKARLEALAGRRVTALALPGGRGGERERRAALAHGYRHLFGSVPGPNRGVRAGHWLQRFAVRRTLDLAGFAALVEWRGLSPRVACARHQALALSKRLLGNARYERLRAHLAR